MSHVILQPTGNKDAKDHYNDTIVQPVDITNLRPFLSEDQYNHLKKLYPLGLIPTWGVTSGKKDTNAKKWRKIKPSDVTFFSANKSLYSSGFVTYKLHNPTLADYLWGKNSEGDTWEYIYFLDEVREHNISLSLFNRIVGYKNNYIIQGFNILDDLKSETLLAYFDISSNITIGEVDEDNYKDIISDFNKKSLDIEGKSKSRAEQSFLRNVLFKNMSFCECGICGNEYPVSFLIAAHIKKRAFCLDKERLDYKNIVMPMCKFGCDELYENGYLFVREGTIIVGEKVTSKPMQTYINKIKGKPCVYWNDATKKYFDWHYRFHQPSKVF